MSVLVYNPITRFAWRTIVLWAYVHMALDLVHGLVKTIDFVKSHTKR